MTIEKFKELLKMGWSLDHIFILEHISEFQQDGGSKEDSLIQKLYRKGMVEILGMRVVPTQDGMNLIEFANNEEIEMVIKTEKPKPTDVLGNLHKKLEDKLLELIGKKQRRVEILGTKYSFLCGKEDLEARIKKVMTKYKLSDVELIEKTLLEYIVKCYKSNRWSPLLQYYIIKQKEGVEMSPLVTDLRNREEKEEIKTEFEI